MVVVLLSCCTPCVDKDGCMINQKINVWRHDGGYVIRVFVILTRANEMRK